MKLIFLKPFLRSLGLSQSLTALVWAAGPLAGTFVQPIVGLLSDQCQDPWGKRKPFMAGGAAATITCMLLLAWTKDLVTLVTWYIGGDAYGDRAQTTTIILAIVWVYALNAAIQPVQSAIRAFIIDNCPAHQQSEATTWASCIMGIGTILGYLSGFLKLKESESFLGNTQFKAMCVIASFALGITVAISCTMIQERDPRVMDSTKRTKLSTAAFFTQLYMSFRTMPPVTWKVCQAQFFSWMGWFPFLFYVTTYVGNFYSKPIFAARPDLTKGQQDAVTAHAIRIGTFAALIFAVIALVSNFTLPFLVAVSSREKSFLANSGRPIPSSFTIPGLTLPRAWTLSHLLFGICMICTLFAKSAMSSAVLVGLVGISRALTLWAPFALISEEVAARQLRRSYSDSVELQSSAPGQAGAIMGLHNMAIASPQIVSALMCSVLFYLLQAAGVDDTIGWTLVFGGISALIAAYLSSRIS